MNSNLNRNNYFRVPNKNRKNTKFYLWV